MRDHKHLKMILVILPLIMLVLNTAVPFSASAEEAERKVVRVGWYDSTFCYLDQFGRRCGIDYEYQHKISAYTGWVYEYVEDSWPNLFQMLKNGEIDLLSDVSYKPERTEYMLFPDLAMGSESYYIYIDANNGELTADNLQAFNGKRIGVNQGSVQEGFLKDWAERNGITLEIVPLVVEEDESMDMVTRGELDGYASIYTFSSEQKTVPVCRIGASEYFYAVNKNRPDLLAELNMALSGIQDADPYFIQRLDEERFYTTRTNVFLSLSQEDWLREHGTIRIGYRDGSLPFCQTDKETGELTGALKDYLAHAANNLRSVDLQFEAIPFRTTQEALDAMKAGEIDCVFPVYINSYDADQMGILLTNPAMTTEMHAVMRASDVQSLSRDNTITFSVSAGDLNIETFIMAQYPSSVRKTFASGEECFAAVASGEADCILVSNYRIPSAEDTITKYKLFSVPSGEAMPLSFAVNKADRELYFLLNKTVVMTKTEDMDSALVSYMRSNLKASFAQFLKDHWIVLIAALSAVFITIVVLLLQKLKAQRKASEQQRLLEEAAEITELEQTIASLLNNMPGMTFTKDAKTGEYLACNKAFAEYAHKSAPEDVVGLTDADMFDSKTAARFEEDDRMAVSMDEPYIFFEDARDAVGNQRQFQNTKLKYTDAAGRLCILGIYQDVTDMVRIQRENATTKEAYEKARSTGIIYTHIAQALARGYTYLYYVNLDTEEFIEYRPDEETGTLSEKRRGWHFFEECGIAADQYVYPDDRELFVKNLERKRLVAALNRDETFIMTYRLLTASGPRYVTLKVSRMEDDDRYIIIGVTDIDEQMKERSAAQRMQEEKIAYARLSALTGDFLCIYVVVPETSRYREFSATTSFDGFARPREGMDFFADSREQAQNVIYREDLNRFLSVMTKENVLTEVERHGIFTLSYRLVIEGKPRYVQLKAAMVEEKEGARLVVGVNDIDSQVRQEEEYVKHLAQARIEANVDPLTGVKNRHAYLVAEERLNDQIAEHIAQEFAIVILDVNDLKKVNDTEGHKAGDQYLRDACKIVCNTFKHSPVFRVGGDEFAVIAQGSDYASIDQLIAQVNDHNMEAIHGGGIVIACGMAKRENDTSVAAVFERADQNMYGNKSALKAKKQD